MKTRQVWPLPFSELPQLQFEAHAASVEVRACGPGEQPQLESREPHLSPEITRTGDWVRVSLGGPPLPPLGGHSFLEGALSQLLSGQFGGDFVLFVPPSLKARLGANLGQVRVTGLYGCDLEVAATAGELRLDDCRGRFLLRAKAGQIVGRRLGGTFAVETGAGEAKLHIVQLDPGAHTVRSTMGAVTLDLARGLDVQIESRTVMGSTRTLFPSRAGAPAVLKVEAELGAVKVREAEAYLDPRHGDWPDWRKKWQEAPSPTSAIAPERAPEPSDLRTILQLVEQRKISPEEAERLISAL